MKNAIIIHGMPSREEYESAGGNFRSTQHWLPWLQEKLISKGVNASALEMPKPYDPDYEKWRNVFEKNDINNQTILVGHSCGGGFLVRWLSENKVNVGKVVLVAPWTDPTKELETDFFNFTIDPDLVSRTLGVTVMYSIDDDEVILKTVNEIKVALPQASFIEFTNKGHFTLEDMGTVEFPELLDLF
jgi:predicted alpha/beta hydrolase family esterase